MSALRKQAVEMLQTVPEDKITYVIYILKGLNGFWADEGARTEKRPAKQADRSEALAAWENFKKYNGFIDADIDVKAELAKARDEKYAGFN